MEVDYAAIGKRIKKFRLALGMTQERLSELSDLTPAHMSHIETGNTKASLPALLKIARALEVTLDDLVLEELHHSKHVSNKEMDELLRDCTDAESKALVRIAVAAKEAIRRIEQG